MEDRGFALSRVESVLFCRNGIISLFQFEGLTDRAKSKAAQSVKRFDGKCDVLIRGCKASIGLP